MKVLVGTEDGLHDVGGGVEFPGRTVTALARDGSAWWSIVDGRAIWRSAGGSWEEVAEGGDLARNCLLPTEAGLFVGTAEAHLLRLARGGMEAVPGFEEIEGRDAWYTPWGGPPDTRSLAVDRNGTLYANVHVGGIARSADGGLTWKRTIDIDTDVHQVLAHPTTPGLVLAATGDAGLAVSANGGDWWDFQTEGLHANYSRAVAVAGDAVLVTASESHLGRNAAVYRRPLSGGAFERCAKGLPEWFRHNIDTHCLAAAGPFAAFGTADGSVFASSDAGETWKAVASGLPRVTCVTLGPE